MPLHSTLRSFRTYAQSSPPSPSSPPSSATDQHEHDEPNQSTSKLRSRLAAVAARTWDLGFTAFGGPPVHFQILHRRFVAGGEGEGEGEGWIDEQTVCVNLCA